MQQNLQGPVIFVNILCVPRIARMRRCRDILYNRADMADARPHTRGISDFGVVIALERNWAGTEPAFTRMKALEKGIADRPTGKSCAIPSRCWDSGTGR